LKKERADDALISGKALIRVCCGGGVQVAGGAGHWRRFRWRYCRSNGCRQYASKCRRATSHVVCGAFGLTAQTLEICRGAAQSRWRPGLHVPSARKPTIPIAP